MHTRAHTHTHTRTHTREVQAAMAGHPDMADMGDRADRAVEPRIRGGEAVVDGVRHSMRTAMPASKTAKQYGLNRNHHVRVWCTCMDNPQYPPGDYSERPLAEVLADPRRLGAYDWLGVADVRESGSALNLFRDHIREVANAGLRRVS